MSITQILTDPDNFFSEKMRHNIKFGTPLLIIGLLAILSAINAMIVAQMIMEVLPAEAAAFAGVGAAIGGAAALITTIIMWIVYAAVFYGISALLGGEGEFKRVLEFVAYGFIPSIFSGIAGIIAIKTSFSVETLMMEDPAMIQQAMLNDPTMKMTMILGMIFTLWSASIWIFGLVHSRNLSVKNALITVGLPIGLYILYSASKFMGV